jgi:hypothetical protein
MNARRDADFKPIRDRSQRVGHRDLMNLRPQNEDARKMRVVGIGRRPDAERIKANDQAGFGDIVSQIQSFKSCPVYNMPVIEQVRQTFSGPLIDADIERTFGAQWDPFAQGLDPAGASFVETTMAAPGQLQTYTLVMAIGVHLEPEPYCWTAQGNAWNHPPGNVNQPPSPDVFSANDIANGALGAAFTGANPTQSLIPSELEWGWWINKALWCFARAYNLRWMIGQHTNIMDEQLRHTAYMPPNAQEGSASSSQQDIVTAVRQTNDYYNSLGAAFEFLKINFLRLGSVGTTAALNNGIFRMSRALEVVGATYGGGDLRSMIKNNSEFRELSLPYLITPGVPIGLKCQETDSVQAALMRAFFSISSGFSTGTVAQITDAADIVAGLTAGGSGNVMLEQTFDATPANVPQQTDAQRIVFKGGEWKMGILLKGYEVDQNWGDVMRGDPTLRDIVLGTGTGKPLAQWASGGR